MMTRRVVTIATRYSSLHHQKGEVAASGCSGSNVYDIAELGRSKRLAGGLGVLVQRLGRGIDVGVVRGHMYRTF